MELPLNMIPRPLPNVCESANECVSPRRGAYGRETRNSSLPIIEIIRLPCGQTTAEIPSQRYRKVEFRSQKRKIQTRVPPKHLFSPLGRPDVSYLKPIPYPVPNPAIRTHSVTKRTSSAQISISQKNSCNSRGQGQMPTFPSSSSMASSTTDPSTRHDTNAPRTKPRYPCLTIPPRQKNEMSERAAETVRVMEWTIEHLKAAEERVREQERAVCEEKEFMLRLRLWEAEMKVRKMVEDEEEDSRPGNEENEITSLDKGVSQSDGQSGMGTYRSFVLERQQKCGIGLGIVLRR